MKSKLSIKIFGISLLICLGLFVCQIFYIYAQSTTCFTTASVAADSRCLYILDGYVYQKGSRSSPHKGNACGTDVSSIIPSFHRETVSAIARYLDPNKVGQIQSSCVTATNTPVPTVPAATATATPTNPAPTATGSPNCALKTSGDADCSGVVNLNDFEIWRRERFGVLTTKTADFDRNNVIDTIDFEIWRRNGVH